MAGSTRPRIWKWCSATKMGFDFKKGVAIIAPVTNFEIVGVAIRSVSSFAESAMN